MNNADKQYVELCEKILAKGNEKGDRTGTGTTSIFGHQMRFDLSEGFPLLTTKKVDFNSIAIELLWFLRGDTNIKFLKENKVKIWDAFADRDGNVGAMYGAQWRDFQKLFWNSKQREHEYVAVDQIANLIDTIKSNPDSRRMVVSAWDVGNQPDESISPVENAEMGNPALPPCHMMFQCYVADGELSLQIYQRSADVFLGLPFNIASYALLIHMLAEVTGLKAGELIWTGGDCHIYNNHLEQISEQLQRFYSGKVHPLPELFLSEIDDINDFTFNNIMVVNYKSEPKIKGSVSV